MNRVNSPYRGEPLRYDLIPTFKDTNTEAEHNKLITGLRIAKGVDVALPKSQLSFLTSGQSGERRTHDEG